MFEIINSTHIVSFSYQFKSRKLFELMFFCHRTDVIFCIFNCCKICSWTYRFPFCNFALIKIMCVCLRTENGIHTELDNTETTILHTHSLFVAIWLELTATWAKSFIVFCNNLTYSIKPNWVLTHTIELFLYVFLNWWHIYMVNYRASILAVNKIHIFRIRRWTELIVLGMMNWFCR